jgi:hypothetical protein
MDQRVETALRGEKGIILRTDPFSSSPAIKMDPAEIQKQLQNIEPNEYP